MGTANFKDPPHGDNAITTTSINTKLRRVFSFAIKNNLLTGSGRVPVHFSCTLGRAALTAEMKKSMSQSPLGGQVELSLPQNASALFILNTSTTVEDLSQVIHVSDTNTFNGTLPFALQGKHYTITLNGEFLSSNSARGSISVTSTSCSGETAYTWEAAPQAPKIK
jgi:hypothetical protein